MNKKLINYMGLFGIISVLFYIGTYVNLYYVSSILSIMMCCVFFQKKLNKYITRGINIFAVMSWISCIGYTFFPYCSDTKAGSLEEAINLLVTLLSIVLIVISLNYIIVGGFKQRRYRILGILAAICLLVMLIGAIGTNLVKGYFNIFENLCIYDVIIFNAILGIYLFLYKEVKSVRYVIVSAVKGEAGEFNNNLRREVFDKFKAKSSRLPAHFTIKAPFEYDGNIEDLDKCLQQFCQEEKAEPYKITGFNHFDDRVIFMDVQMSEEAKELHDRLIDKLSTIPYIKFNRKDGKGKIFHVTVTSKRIQPIFNDVWNYVSKKKCNYDCSFNNIRIYIWEDSSWKLYNEYNIKD